MRIVVAFGGNAITRPGQDGDIASQFVQTQQTAVPIVDLLEQGHEIVLTHGNGPQVGAAMRRVELAEAQVYPLPLEVCVADTQGGIGYMIAQCVRNELRSRNIPNKPVTCLVTTVVVEQSDPAFEHPTKPIGSYFGKLAADIHAERDGWSLTEVSPGQFRRVVASPSPAEILEAPAIESLIRAGHIVVACGGGGIPVLYKPDSGYVGVAAVIDKDRASALLANRVQADMLIILTAVECVAIGFGTEREQALPELSVEQAKQYLLDGEFPAGSMGPKIEAAINFIEGGSADARVLITTPENAPNALAGSGGTWINR